LVVADKAGKGLCRKTWLECVKGDEKDVACPGVGSTSELTSSSSQEGCGKADANAHALGRLKYPLKCVGRARRKTMMMIMYNL